MVTCEDISKISICGDVLKNSAHQKQELQEFYAAAAIRVHLKWSLSTSTNNVSIKLLKCHFLFNFVLDKSFLSLVYVLNKYLVNHLLDLFLGWIVSHALENCAQLLRVNCTISILIKYYKCVPKIFFFLNFFS